MHGLALDVVVPSAPKISATFWILARAGGVLAYVLLTSTVLAGLAHKSRLVKRAKPAMVVDLHRFLSLLTLGAVGVHLGMLLLDRNKPTTPLSLVVPGVMAYRPLWTASGVVTFELMILIHLSFRYRTKIGPKNWRRLHWATYAAFVGATTHGLMSGSDSDAPWTMALYTTAAALTVGLTAWRVLSVRAAAASRRSAASVPPSSERRPATS